MRTKAGFFCAWGPERPAEDTRIGKGKITPVQHGRRNPNQPPHKKIMSVPIRIRRRQSGNAGAPGVLKSAELAFNEVDGILYYGKGIDGSGNATQIVGIGGNASSSYADGLIATEQAARIAADNTLTTNLASEVTRATAAEGVLTTNLASEVTRATAAETALGTRIDNVLSNVTPGSLDSLSEVVSAFQAADSSLNGAITSLASSPSTGLTNEVNRATAAEAALASDISDIETDASALTSRVTSAESSITANATAISAESTARAAAISAETSARQSAISSEASTRLSADNALSARILVLETEIDGGSF